MTTAYTSLLGLALPVTGELSGTWGDTVNDYITQYLDASVAGTQTISGSQTAVTLSKTTNASLSQAGSGATGSSQYNVINCTGNPASMLTVTVPAASKTYVVVNATSTNQDVKIVGAGPTTGVTLVAGERAIIAWNGSDFIKVATSTADGVTTLSFGSTGLTPSTATSGAVTVAGTLVAANGGTGQSTYTTGDLLYATGSTALSKLGIGTNGQILTSTGTAPQWSTLSGVAVTTFSAGTTGFTPSSATSGAVTLAGTLATTNGGTGLTSFTANGVVYASSTSALTTGSALVFDGTNLGVGAPSPQAKVHALGSGSGAAEIRVQNTSSSTDSRSLFRTYSNASTFGGSLFMTGTSDSAYPTSALCLYNFDNLPLVFGVNNTEGARLTSTGLGIGTSSPSYRLDVQAATAVAQVKSTTGTNAAYYVANNTGGDFYIGRENSAGTTFGTAAYSAVLWSAGAYPMSFFTNGTERMRLDSSGNLGLGVTPSASWDSIFKAIQIGSASYLSIAAQNTVAARGSILWNAVGSGDESFVYRNTGDPANRFMVGSGFYAWYTAPSGTAGNPISFGDAKMTLDASGNLLVGTTSSTYNSAGRGVIELNGSSDNIFAMKVAGAQNFYVQSNATNTAVWNVANTYMSFGTNNAERARITSGGNLLVGTTVDIQQLSMKRNTSIGWVNAASNGSDQIIYGDNSGNLQFYTNNTERTRITAAGFTQPVAYADTVSALGNTGTATTINLQTANVFTATLTGNCTFTLSNPIATGSSSFTLILTNDGTAGRTVAWAGGSFVFPGGAASLSRTTTANAVDVWVFFTPNGGTTWYGNIAMKNMTA